MNRPIWIPVQGQTVYTYEEPEDSLLSTRWDESDPYLVGLWKQGKVFASLSEALAAQKEALIAQAKERE